MKLEKINVVSIWTMLTGTVLAVTYMFSNFVSAADFTEFKTDINYSLYYELFEKHLNAVSKDQHNYAEELKRQMEKIKAKICEEDPKWERCEKS
jgi:hypothetical protein